jgi:tetratricopeptide (TPR) repeat protein
VRALVAGLSVAVLALGSVAADRLHAQEEIFEQGNQLYLEADFTGAAEAYEAVLDAGFESFALHYNLGNAHFKAGELGLAILAWERARALAPSDPDVLANLELARSQTVDAIEPIPRFWLLSVASWWVGLLPRGALIALVAAAWLIVGAGVAVRVLARRAEVANVGTWAALVGAVVVLVFGTNLFVRELGIGSPERGVILADAVPVRSAPADQDDLTLFEIHEGTRVRIDERAGEWAEVVLDDGKVGWVLAEVFEEI